MSSELIKRAEKGARFLISSKMTLDEYATNLLQMCVTYSEIDSSIARLVAQTTPREARERIALEIEQVLLPSYRFTELHYGGPGPSPEVREEQRQIYETRVRDFARMLRDELQSQ